MKGRVAIALVVVALAAAARAELPAGPDAPTRGAFLRARQAFELRRALGQYDKSPRRKAALDAAARQFLTGCVGRWNEQPDAPPLAELERQGRMLILDGCDDPLVQSFYARLSIRFDRLPSTVSRGAMPTQADGVFSIAKPFLSVDDLAKRGYDGAFQADAMRALRAVRERIGSVEEFKGRDAVLIAAIARAAGDGSYAAAERAFLVYDLGQWTYRFTTDNLLQLADALDKQPAVDELIKALVRGRYHAGAAREGRPGADHDGQGRRLLIRAWELDPTVPDAAVAMLKTCLADLDPDRRAEARQWFDRAVKARLDAPEAYAAYFAVLRAGGAAGAFDAAVYAAGVEAAHSARFDTEAPRQLVTALKVVLNDAGGDYEAWNKLGAWPELKKVYAGYVADPSRKGATDVNRSALAAFAARLGKYGEAREQLDVLVGPVDADAADEAGYRPADLVGEVHAHSGALAELTVRAERFAAAGNFKQAIEVYDRAAGLAAASAEARRFLRGRMQSARWQQAFEAGEWVDLWADGDLSGFDVESGDWAAEADGAVTLRVVSNQSRLMARLDVGEHWEVSCDVVFLEASDPWSNGGVALVPRQRPAAGHSVQLYSNAKKLYAGEGYYGPGTIEQKFERFNKLEARQQGGRTSVTVNGKELVTQRAMEHYGQYGPVRVGLGCQVFRIGDVIRFERVRIRKLAA